MRSIAVRPARAAAAAAVRARFASTAASATELPSFTRALFQGKLESAAVFPYCPKDVVTADQKDMLAQSVESTEKFMTEVNDAYKNDDTASIPENVRKGLRELGAYGLQVPEEYGGLGLTNTGYARLVEVVGGHDLGVGIHLGASQSIGYKGILLYGTPEQKAKYLPKLATGEHVACFSLTEPSTGSDANSVRSRAVQQPDGSWRLSGGKLWSSNGGEAEIFTVFAQTSVPDPTAPGGKKDKVTAFIVERSFGGVTNGPPEKKLGIKCSNTAEVYFDNTPVPAENVIGEVGGGFKVAMGILNMGRFGMGAALSGTMKACIKGAVTHANERVQFGKKIKEYGNIKDKIAGMATRCYGAESLAYMLAANMDRGQTDFMLEAAAGKVFASDAAWWTADTAIQILGGLGFMHSPALPYSRILRDLRIFRIFEGENFILQGGLLAGTGMQSAGKALEPIIKAAKAPAANLGVLAPFALQLAKGKLGVPDVPRLSGVAPALASSAAIVEQATAAFGAACTGVLVNKGKKLVDEQICVARIGEVATDLTVAAAVISRASRAVTEKSPTADIEVALAACFTLDASARLKQNLDAINSYAGRFGSSRPALEVNWSKLQKLKYTVADACLEKEGYPATAPLGF